MELERSKRLNDSDTAHHDSNVSGETSQLLTELCEAKREIAENRGHIDLLNATIEDHAANCNCNCYVEAE